METYLSQRGYAIIKNDKNKTIIDNLKKDLKVSPIIMSPLNSKDGNKEYPLFLESDNKIYIPKCYGLEKFGKPIHDNLSSGLDCPNLIFKGSLRDIQKIPIDNFIKSAENPEKLGGIISVPCGFGKTIMAIYIACYLKKKNFIHIP